MSDRAQTDRQERALRDRDFLLDSTIAMGLYNNEVANSFLEKSMRYTAVSSSLLYDHVVALETKVCRLVSSHWGRGPMEMGVYMLGTFQALS